MPLPSSVRRAAIEPTIVTSRPSRIQTVPRPITTSQWKRDHGSRSKRAGTRVSTVPSWALSLAIAAMATLGEHVAKPTSVPLLRPPLALHGAGQHDALGVRAGLRRRGGEALRDTRGRQPLRARLRPRGPLRRRPPPAAVTAAGRTRATARPATRPITRAAFGDTR